MSLSSSQTDSNKNHQIKKATKKLVKSQRGAHVGSLLAPHFTSTLRTVLCYHLVRTTPNSGPFLLFDIHSAPPY